MKPKCPSDGAEKCLYVSHLLFCRSHWAERTSAPVTLISGLMTVSCSLEHHRFSWDHWWFTLHRKWGKVISSLSQCPLYLTCSILSPSHGKGAQYVPLSSSQHFPFSYCPQSSLFGECVSGNGEGLEAEIRGFFCLSKGHKRLRGCYFSLWGSTNMQHGKMTRNPCLIILIHVYHRNCISLQNLFIWSIFLFWLLPEDINSNSSSLFFIFRQDPCMHMPLPCTRHDYL